MLRLADFTLLLKPKLSLFYFCLTLMKIQLKKNNAKNISKQTTSAQPSSGIRGLRLDVIQQRKNFLLFFSTENSGGRVTSILDTRTDGCDIIF